MKFFLGLLVGSTLVLAVAELTCSTQLIRGSKFSLAEKRIGAAEQNPPSVAGPEEKKGGEEKRGEEKGEEERGGEEKGQAEVDEAKAELHSSRAPSDPSFELAALDDTPNNTIDEDAKRPKTPVTESNKVSVIPTNERVANIDGAAKILGSTEALDDAVEQNLRQLPQPSSNSRQTINKENDAAIHNRSAQIWTAFYSERSAEGFAKQLSQTLGVAFQVRKMDAQEYWVTFAYDEVHELDEIRAQITKTLGQPE